MENNTFVESKFASRERRRFTMRKNFDKRNSHEKYQDEWNHDSSFTVIMRCDFMQ